MPKYFYAEDQHPRYEARIASVGITRSGVEVRVVDADHRDLSREEIGEIVVRGDVVMAGYWNNPDASTMALRNGWLHTGDLDAHCLANIARFKRPKQYVFVSDLPKNHYGKVLKTELRRTAAALSEKHTASAQ